jgi:hypothetical protein
MNVRHHLALTGASTLRTTPLALAERAVRDVASAHAMGVMHGPAGCGKTFAWQSAARLLDIEVCAVQFPSRPSMLHVARVLLQRLTGRPPKGNRFDLSDLLIDLLAERDRLVVIDEAQWLNRDCIEYTRHLHDDPETRFGVLLVGGDGCWEVLSREPMLRSRLHRRVVFGPLERGAVLRAIPTYHALYHDVDADLIGLIDDTFAHGNLRAWAEFTHTALEIKPADDAPLTEPIARAVIALHDGGSLDP